MAQERTIQEIITIARISQFLAGNDIANNNALKGGALDGRLDRTLLMERYAIEKIYALNPSEPFLRKASNYLFALCGKYAYLAEAIINDNAGTLPVVAGPANQTINISGTASFTITVSSNSDYTVAWYKNGELVPGQTGLNYSYAATTANNGDTVSALVTNAKGTASSGTGVLTVTNVQQAFLWVGDSDEYANISAGIDNLTYQQAINITPGGTQFQFDVTPETGNNRYNIAKWPVSWGVITFFKSTDLNKGNIPGPEFYQVAQINQFYFACSREALSFDPNFDLIFSKIAI